MPPTSITRTTHISIYNYIARKKSITTTYHTASTNPFFIVDLRQVLELLGVPDESVSLLSGGKVIKIAFQLLWNSPIITWFMIFLEYFM